MDCWTGRFLRGNTKLTTESVLHRWEPLPQNQLILKFDFGKHSAHLFPQRKASWTFILRFA